MTKYAAAVDENQPAVVKLFRKLGWSVQVLSTVGGGVPDIIVGKNQVNLFVEIKDGNKPPSARKLTTAQVKWHKEWRGNVHIVISEDDVLFLNKTFSR